MSTPPKWFLGFTADIAGRFPGWKCTEATVLGYWQTLQDIPADELAGALLRHHATSKFPPAASELRDAARANASTAVYRLTASEAWDEMRRNRKLYSPYASHEQNQRIRWSSEAVRRAADAVCWTDMNWSSEQIPTIRAQFERYYNAIKDKQDRIDSHEEIAGLIAMAGGSVALRGMAQLYGADYRDPVPENTHAEEWDEKDPEWRESADLDSGDEA